MFFGDRWAQPVSTAHALVNPVLSPWLETCHRRWPPIPCLELCPLPSVARLLTIAWPTRETNPAGEWLPCAACVDATRRVAPLTKLGAASVTRWSCSSTMRARPPSLTTSSCRLARRERSAPTRLFVRGPKKSDAQPSRLDALYGVLRTGRLKISARDAATPLVCSGCRISACINSRRTKPKNVASPTPLRYRTYVRFPRPRRRGVCLQLLPVEIWSVDGSQSETRERPR